MTITRDFCQAIADAYGRPLPADARSAGERSLLNVAGTAVGAARTPAVDIAVAHGLEFGGPGVAPVPGRTERLDASNAARATGIAAHLDDFDDTHLATVIHPGAATFAAVLALGAWRGASGQQALSAFVLGCEAQLRVGNAISPGHYDAGWHITGTCGVIGAAVAAGLLIGLDAPGLEQAVGIAASQTLGHREAFGSMTKAFHAGQAAANGIMAALLAEDGFTGSADVFTAPRGFFAVLAPDAGTGPLLDGFGTRWELGDNAFKPYPCGIVSHPAIDAALEVAPRLRAAGAGPAEITGITLTCNPLVVELMGRVQPDDGLQARFSAAHTVAAALADGRLALPQFADDRVVREDVARLRGLIAFDARTDVPRDAARIRVRLASGADLHADVAHARGSLARPLTGAELADKVRGLVEPVTPGMTAPLTAAVDDLHAQPTLHDLADALTPAQEGAA
jgi:2-methylcitrate dehydratase PrpD